MARRTRGFDDTSREEMMLNLGFSYLPGSIRARLNDVEIQVDEINPDNGSICVHFPSEFDGELVIDFQRRLLRGDGPRRDEIIATATACIYCGAKTELTDEHIIPYALEGNLVVANGSCKLCAAKTSKIEMAVLRGGLLGARTALKMRTRRPRRRPVSLPVLRKSGDTTTAFAMPVCEHPTYLALPLFAPPALVRGADSPNLVVVQPGMQIISVSAVTLQMAAQQLGGEAHIRESLDIYAFARLLAKIAHGIVAASDLGDFESFLLGPLFANDESVGQFVGGAPDVRLEKSSLHEVSVEVIDSLVHTRIRLFAQLGGPEYLVIAGRVLDETTKRTALAIVEQSS